MRKFFCIIIAACSFLFAQDGFKQIVESEGEYSSAKIVMAKTNTAEPVLVVLFSGTEGMHYYADAETAPGGMVLEVLPKMPQCCEIIEAQFPDTKLYYDKALQKEINVYSGNFAVTVQLECADNCAGEVSLPLNALACTDNLCLRFNETLTASFDISQINSWQSLDEALEGFVQETQKEIAPEKFIKASEFDVSGSVKYFLLAILAGFMFNLMPCVWPVLPLAVQRLVNFSGGNRKTLLMHGVAFCCGIMLFFVIFAVISIVLKLTTGSALDWSEHLRYPWVIASMGLLLIVLALFMFDVFVVGVPTSIATKSGGDGTIGGSVGMGFLAAILSTPCSGAILAAVLVWAQTQPLPISTIAILLLGVGMMLPYLLLANSPNLLKKLPKPGTWMEILRKAMGFVLLVIAVKLFAALPEKLLEPVGYFALVISFAAWMWGGWVNMATPKKKRYSIRILAIVLVVACGVVLFQPNEAAIDWQDYDRQTVATLKAGQKPILIKFTAKWCTNCHYLERTVYADQKIADLLENKQVAVIKADTTSHEDPATADLKEIYNEPGSVPVSVIIMPDGEMKKLRGIFDRNELIEILETL